MRKEIANNALSFGGLCVIICGVFSWHLPIGRLIFTLRVKLSGAVYCNRYCLCVFVGWFVCLWVCYHDNSKLRAPIFTKLGLWVKVVTISS